MYYEQCLETHPTVSVGCRQGDLIVAVVTLSLLGVFVPVSIDMKYNITRKIRNSVLLSFNYLYYTGPIII